MDTSYTYLRQFTPNVLAAIDFHGGPGTAELMQAVAMLADLNRTGGRKVPDSAPDSFVPTRFRDYLAKGPAARRRHRVPALLGAVFAAQAAQRVALRGRTRAGLAALRRPGTYLFGLPVVRAEKPTDMADLH
jgi:hypothetical protein